jgi:hypothetical protein
VFRHILEHRRGRTHDVGFQFSLHAVADCVLTDDASARDMALAAANTLIGRFRPEGGYIQAWSPLGPGDRRQAAFVNGRMIADTMQNLALLLAHGAAHVPASRCDTMLPYGDYYFMEALMRSLRFLPVANSFLGRT